MPTLAQRWIDEGKKYGRQEEWRKGWLQGWLEGFLEGWCQTELRIARNMLLDGYKEEIVMKCTGLNKEEIKRLINQ